MRLDKFLKVSRLVKRRTLAKEICDRGHVLINGRTAKAASEVKAGDVLTLNFGARRLTVRVRELREAVPAKEAAGLYEVIEDLRLQVEEDPAVW